MTTIDLYTAATPDRSTKQVGSITWDGQQLRGTTQKAQWLLAEPMWMDRGDGVIEDIYAKDDPEAWINYLPLQYDSYVLWAQRRNG
jgi:hypothetical protein